MFEPANQVRALSVPRHNLRGGSHGNDSAVSEPAISVTSGSGRTHSRALVGPSSVFWPDFWL